MMKKERASARARRDAHRGKGANAERTHHGHSHGLFVDVRTAFSRSGLLRHHGTGYPHGQATAAGPRRPARARRPDAEPRSWETEGGELPSGTWHPGGGLFSVLAGSDPHAAGPEGLRANGGKARHGHADAGPWGTTAWPTAGRAQRFADVALPCAALVKVPTSLGCTGIPRWRGHLTGGLRAARLLIHAPTH